MAKGRTVLLEMNLLPEDYRKVHLQMNANTS